MLIDPVFRSAPDPITAMIAAINGQQVVNQRLAQGFYLSGHWSFDRDVLTALDVEFGGNFEARYARMESLGLPGEYGVCDSPEQFMARFGPALEAAPDRYVVSFVIIRKETQGDGGWRWHKWGPYVGEKEPQHEYLADEGPEITQATTFHVYRALP